MAAAATIALSLPEQYSQLPAYAASKGLDLEIARSLFAQVSALRVISVDAMLREFLVLRGAAALRLFYGAERNSNDLDFVCLCSPQDFRSAKEKVAQHLNEQLKAGLPRFVPPFDGRDSWLTSAIKVHLSECDYVFEFQWSAVTADSRVVKVSSLEDILADKVLAIGESLQRGAKRPTDLFDVAAAMQRHDPPDRRRVVELLREKLQRRGNRGADWHRRLPQQINELASAYQSMVSSITISVVAPSFADSRDSVLALLESSLSPSPNE